MRLYIIRHGTTEWNKVKRLQGTADIPLDEDGMTLARVTGERMKEIPLDLIISSPLKRARQTAELVTEGRNIPLLTDERIQEMSFGDWEGELIMESPAISKEFRELFYEDPLHCVRPPRGETFQEVIARTAVFLEALTGNKEFNKKNLLISTHGAAGRCLLYNFYQDGDLWRGGVPKNCSVCIVEMCDGKWVVLEKDKIF